MRQKPSTHRMTTCLTILCAGIVFAGPPAIRERVIMTTGPDTNLILQKTIEKYDSRGNLIESDRYLPNGTLEVKIKRQYDIHGKKIRETRYDCFGEICAAVSFRYDADGAPVERNKSLGIIPLGDIYFEETGPVSPAAADPNTARTSTVYLRHDEEGLLLTRREVDCTGSLCQIINYFYDTRNRQIDQDYYDPDNRLLKRIKSSYDTNQRITGLSVYDPSGGITAQSTFTYDEAGRLSVRLDHDPRTSALISTTRNTWDGDLLGFSETGDAGGQVTETVDFAYDIWGRLLKETHYGYGYSLEPQGRTVIRTVQYRYK